MRRCRTWWALPGRLGSANGRDAFYCFARPTVRAQKPSSLALRAGGREPRRPAGFFFRIFRSAVRAQKPSSLALRAGVREPRRRPGSFFRIFKSAVRARKPSSLALRAGVREPRRPAGSFFRIFRSAVRARKPSSLTLRADVREPRRPGSCVQMKRDARKAPPASVHLSHYYIFKRKELTTNSHSSLVVVNSNHPSLPPALICILCHQKLTIDDRPSVSGGLSSI